MRASASTLTPPTDATQLTRRRAVVAAGGGAVEVLHDGSEVELVAGAGQAAQPHALEAVMGLQVCKAHLDPFSHITRLEERLGLHLAPRHVAGVFVEVAHDPA